VDRLGATHFLTFRNPSLGRDPYFGNHCYTGINEQLCWSLLSTELCSSGRLHRSEKITSTPACVTTITCFRTTDVYFLKFENVNIIFLFFRSARKLNPLPGGRMGRSWPWSRPGTARRLSTSNRFPLCTTCPSWANCRPKSSVHGSAGSWSSFIGLCSILSIYIYMKVFEELRMTPWKCTKFSSKGLNLFLCSSRDVDVCALAPRKSSRASQTAVIATCILPIGPRSLLLDTGLVFFDQSFRATATRCRIARACRGRGEPDRSQDVVGRTQGGPTWGYICLSEGVHLLYAATWDVKKESTFVVQKTHKFFKKSVDFVI